MRQAEARIQCVGRHRVTVHLRLARTILAVTRITANRDHRTPKLCRRQVFLIAG